MKAKRFARALRCGGLASQQLRTWGETYRYLAALERHGARVLGWYGWGYTVRLANGVGTVEPPVTEVRR